jgi:hypothetical protein
MKLFLHRFVVSSTLALLIAGAIALPALAANQCPGETTEGDAACNAITAGTVCCVVIGQDNSCQTTPECIVLQANAAPGTSQTQTSPTTNSNEPAVSQTTGQGELLNPLGINSLEELLQAVLRAVVRIGAILLVLALVWTGFLFVFAQGNEEKIKSARQALFWTVIGGLVLLGAEAISLVLSSTIEGLRTPSE